MGEGHVLLGGFDGDATAYQMLVDGYLDADGARICISEALLASGLLDLKEGKPVQEIILDKEGCHSPRQSPRGRTANVEANLRK
ncbi:MAG: hypothetical protein WKF84_05830 [Pyrinomonadaceae bacterium]